MKVGALCKVRTYESPNGSQFGHFVVVIRKLSSNDRVWSARNLNTGNVHQYYIEELREVKKCP